MEVRDCEEIYTVPSSAFYWEKSYHRQLSYKTTLVCSHVLYSMRHYEIGEMVTCPICEKASSENEEN
jgi:hypothetical protein